jgi:hypothetical protein
MIGFARFTAIIIILLGVIVIVIGGGIVYRGITNVPTPAPAIPGLAPNFSGMFAFAGLIAGAAIAFQGLMLAAVGQVLWLLAGMADQAVTSNQYLEELVNRMGNAVRR